MLTQMKTRSLKNVQQPMRKGSVQQRYVGARETRQDVLCLNSSMGSNGREYRAIIEIPGINFLLKSEREQLLITDIYQHFLASLTHSVQLLIRVLPLNLSPYLERLTPPQREIEAMFRENENTSASQVSLEEFLGVWRELASSQMEMLRTLAVNRTLLERHFYLVIPADVSRVQEQSVVKALGFKRKKYKRNQREAEFERARQQLAQRVLDISRHLADMGLTARRLSNKELVHLYHSCIMPRKAMRNPLPDAVVEGIDRLPLPGEPGRSTRALPHTFDASTGGTNALSSILPAQSRRRIAGFGRWQSKKKGPGGTDHKIQAERDFVQFADVVAPASVVLQPDALIVEKEYNRVLVVDALPRFVSLGFMKPLAEIDEPMEVSIFYTSQNSGPAIHRLNRKRAEYRSTRNTLQRRDNFQHPELQVAEGDVEDLVPKVASGEERMHDVAIYILLRGSSLRELDERTERLTGTLQNMLVVTRSALFEQDLAYRSCMPECRNLLGRNLWLNSRSAAFATFPFISSTLFMRDGIIEGITPMGEPVVLDWWSPEQRNANRLVVAPSGSGKSYKCKIDLERMYIKYMRGWDGRGGLPFQAFVIDPDGEWERVCARLGGQYIRFAPGSPHHINPFALPVSREYTQVRTGYAPEEDRRTDVLAEARQQQQALLEIMLADRSASGAGTLSGAEKGLIDRCLSQMYRDAGITSDPITHHLPPPLMKDLYELLASGEYGPDPTGLAQRLRRYVDGGLSGLFSGQTNVRLDSPVVVFNVPKDNELRAILYFLISQHVWNVSFGSNIPRMLVVDEMLSLFEHPEGAHFLETLFQRSRKHYLSLIGIVQQPLMLQQSSIPANCATTVLMKQEAASVDFVSDLFKLSEQEKYHLSMCSKGDALFLNNQNRLFIHFAASDLEHRIASTDPVELARWEEEEREEKLRNTSSAHRKIQTLHLPEVGNVASTASAFQSPAQWNGLRASDTEKNGGDIV